MTTPGPYQISQTDGSYAVIASDGHVVAICTDEDDARLLGAAPDLLAALKAKMEARVHTERVDADNLARAAIAKATGASA